MLTFLLWCLLLVVCWPLALLALILYPIVWLILLPFRIVGIAVGGVFEFCGRSCFCLRGCSAVHGRRSLQHRSKRITPGPSLNSTSFNSNISPMSKPRRPTLALSRLKNDWHDKKVAPG